MRSPYERESRGPCPDDDKDVWRDSTDPTWREAWWAMQQKRQQAKRNTNYQPSSISRGASHFRRTKDE